jgi:hypothetical protein
VLSRAARGPSPPAWILLEAAALGLDRVATTREEREFH